MKSTQVPVITIDGPSGSGKGTVSLLLSKHLHWHYLESGAIYRAIAWATRYYGVDPENKLALKHLLSQMQIVLKGVTHEEEAKVMCDNHDITQDIRAEECGVMASQVASYPMVRESVLQYQRDFRRFPGLVADGRDMGTVVFPEATLKFFLQADPKERVLRRYRQ